MGESMRGGRTSGPAAPGYRASRSRAFHFGAALGALVLALTVGACERDGATGGSGSGSPGSGSSDAVGRVPGEPVPAFGPVALPGVSATFDDRLYVRLTDGRGYDLLVPAVAGDPLTFYAPPYLEPDTGELAAGDLSVSVVQADGAETAATGTLHVLAPPEVDLPPGELSAAFLTSARDGTADALTSLAQLLGPRASTSGQWQRLTLASSLIESHQALSALLVAMEEVRSGRMDRVPLANVHTPQGLVPAELTMASLAVSDRLIAAFLLSRRAESDGVAYGALHVRGRALSGDEEADLLGDARSWYQDMVTEVRQGVLDGAQSLADKTGTLLQVAGIAATVVGATSGLPALAAVGGVAWLATTYAPAAIAFTLDMAATFVGSDDPAAADLYEQARPTLKYLFDRTLDGFDLASSAVDLDPMDDEVAYGHAERVFRTTLEVVNDDVANVLDYLEGGTWTQYAGLLGDLVFGDHAGCGSGPPAAIRLAPEGVDCGTGFPDEQGTSSQPGVCDAAQTAGGDEAEIRTIELGAPGGVFGFNYDTYSIEDRLVVTYEGNVLYDTGCVGGSENVQIGYSGSSTSVTVSVTPNCAGTEGTSWEFTVTCP